MPAITGGPPLAARWRITGPGIGQPGLAILIGRPSADVHSAAPVRFSADRCQRLLQVGQQVIDMFDADAQPHRIHTDPGTGQLLG